MVSLSSIRSSTLPTSKTSLYSLFFENFSSFSTTYRSTAATPIRLSKKSGCFLELSAWRTLTNGKNTPLRQCGRDTSDSSFYRITATSTTAPSRRLSTRHSSQTRITHINILTCLRVFGSPILADFKKDFMNKTKHKKVES